MLQCINTQTHLTWLKFVCPCVHVCVFARFFSYEILAQPFCYHFLVKSYYFFFTFLKYQVFIYLLSIIIHYYLQTIIIYYYFSLTYQYQVPLPAFLPLPKPPPPSIPPPFCSSERVRPPLVVSQLSLFHYLAESEPRPCPPCLG